MISSAEYVIDLFGGLSATARALGKPVTTVQGWKDRERIPTDHWDEIIQKAADQGTELTFEDFLRRHEPGSQRSPTPAPKKGRAMAS
ncbi:carph-isopro domain-containing protein [Pelagibacterium sediminicola]|uniref:carph-isopro domain-containing protein n=1 Tax=Pelagibacterium sediminicola TaxID=2248761 RepID=UPI000E3224F9